MGADVQCSGLAAVLQLSLRLLSAQLLFAGILPKRTEYVQPLSGGNAGSGLQQGLD